MAIITPPSTGLTKPKQSQLQTNKVEFNDPLLLINKGEGSQANDGDIGVIFDRGNSDNVGIIWDESTDEFAFVITSEDGNTDGNILIQSYGEIKVDTLNCAGTGALQLPVGTTAQRPDSPSVGMMRFNTDTGHFEGWTGSDWIHLETVYG